MTDLDFVFNFLFSIYSRSSFLPSVRSIFVCGYLPSYSHPYLINPFPPVTKNWLTISCHVFKGTPKYTFYHKLNWNETNAILYYVHIYFLFNYMFLHFYFNLSRVSTDLKDHTYNIPVVYLVLYYSFSYITGVYTNSVKI